MPKLTIEKIKDIGCQHPAHFIRAGQLTIQMLIFGAVAVIAIGAFITWSNIVVHDSARNSNRVQSFAIAEAGIEYYRWHLAHASQDFKDGTNQAGPYVHNYTDKDGVVVGQFVLDITPPPINTTIVTITSTGKSLRDPTADKVIKVQMGVPSYAKYAALTDAVTRFGQGTEVFGPVHSNQGIRFDGLAHNLVTSAAYTYDDPDHNGSQDKPEYGVHTHRDLPPAITVNDNFRPLESTSSPFTQRNDVFLAGRQNSATPVDFTKITQSLSQIKAGAETSTGYYASSTALGYHLVLKTDDSFDLYRVTGLVASPNGTCTNSQNQASNQGGWGTWSIQDETKIATSTPFPLNGLLFLEDNLWVDGTINIARLTIASGRFPTNAATYSSITLNKDLRYTNVNGADVIALIAQNNINIGLMSTSTIRIDAALVAQNGRVGRYYYNSSCGSTYIRSTLTSYGMIASGLRYGFAYSDGTGYTTRNLIYDANLIYGPPPSFPLTSDQYTLISWQEIK